MERREILITVVGLLGTFLLPWPGGEEPATVQGAETRMAVGANRCVHAAQPAGGARDHDRGAVRIGARDGLAFEPAGPDADRCVSLRCGV